MFIACYAGECDHTVNWVVITPFNRSIKIDTDKTSRNTRKDIAMMLSEECYHLYEVAEDQVVFCNEV